MVGISKKEQVTLEALPEQILIDIGLFVVVLTACREQKKG